MRFRSIVAAALVAAVGNLASAGHLVYTGHDPLANTAGSPAVRYRNFNSTAAQQEIYLGVADLGISANRIPTDYAYALSQTFKFGYDATTDKIYQQIGAGAVTQFPGGLGTYIPSQVLNYLQISVNGSASQLLELSNLKIDGVVIGTGTFNNNVPPLTASNRDWYVLGLNMNNGFEVTGTITLGALSGWGNGDGDVINFRTGHSDLPVVPLPTTGGLAGLGLLAIGARRRRVA